MGLRSSSESPRREYAALLPPTRSALCTARATKPTAPRRGAHEGRGDPDRRKFQRGEIFSGCALERGRPRPGPPRAQRHITWSRCAVSKPRGEVLAPFYPRFLEGCEMNGLGLRRYRYSLLGVLLALGAPLGLLFVRAVALGAEPSLAWLLTELSGQRLIYTYLALSTSAVFLLLGYLLGGKTDALFAISSTDVLTALFNRRYFDEQLA